MTELLFYGGQIVTVDELYPTPEAIVVRAGKIEFVGSLERAEMICGNDVSRIDLKGDTLVPGFIDAHSHPVFSTNARGAPVVDIRAEIVPTYAAVLEKIKRRVAISKPGDFLLFFGLDPQLQGDMVSAPTLQELDQIAPDNPLGIQTSNLHALYMNSAALAACGINKDTPTPKGGMIERDDAGHPTGKTTELSTWLALETFYNSFGDDRVNGEFLATIQSFIEQGITTTTEHLYLPYFKANFQNALNNGWPLPRIAAYQQAVAADMPVEKLDIGDDRFWMAGIKIHADGSPFVGNIWVSEPYLDNPTTLEKMDLRPGHTGHMNYSENHMKDMIQTYLKDRWQISVHAQGDRTIDVVLDLIEEALDESGNPDHRFRLEHCALMRDDQIERAVRLGVLSSFFINHITYWGGPIEDVLFGPERASHYMPAGSAAKAGMRISLHADTPMTDPSALALIQAGMTRIANDGRCLGKAECLDALTALKAVTIDAAFQINKENVLGSITPGKHADLVILDKNPLEHPPNDITNIKIRETFLAGESVWHHGE